MDLTGKSFATVHADLLFFGFRDPRVAVERDPHLLVTGPAARRYLKAEKLSPLVKWAKGRPERVRALAPPNVVSIRAALSRMGIVSTHLFLLANPSATTLSLEDLRARDAALTAFNFRQPVDLMSRVPSLLTSDLTELEDVLLKMTIGGVADAVAAVSLDPKLLAKWTSSDGAPGTNDSTTHSRIGRLSYLGFANPRRLYLAVPALREMDVGDINSALRVLSDAGFVDVIGLTSRAPYVMTYVLDQSLLTRLARLRRMGLVHVVELVQHLPALLHTEKDALPSLFDEHVARDWDSQDEVSFSILNFERVVRLYSTLRQFELDPHALPSDVKRFSLTTARIEDLRRPLRDLFKSDEDRLLKFIGRNFAEASALLTKHSRLRKLSLIDLLRSAQIFERFGVLSPLQTLLNIPELFNLSPVVIQTRLGALIAAGFTAPKDMIRRLPQLLLYDLEASLTRRLNILGPAWGFTLANVEERPYLLKFSEERLADTREYLSELNFDVRTLPLQMRILLVRSLDRAKLRAALASAGFTTVEAQREALATHLYGRGIFMKYFKCDDVLKSGPR